MEGTLEHSRARDHAFDHVWALYFAMAQLHALRRDAAEIGKLLPEFERRARSQRLLFFEQVIGPFCRALAERHAGDPVAGGRRMAALLAGLQAARVTPIVADAKIHCAECALAMRQPSEALVLVEEVFAQISQPGCELGYLHPELLRIKGLGLYHSGERDEAELSLRNALQVARSQKAKWWELRAATHYGRLLGQESRREEARALLAPVYDWFTEGHDTRDLQDAAALLRELK
jgi:predicted ATPase